MISSTKIIAIKCPLCGEIDRSAVLVNHHYYSIRRCRACGLIYQQTPSNFTCINYDNIYQERSRARPLTRSQKRKFNQILYDINHAHPQRGKLLEIGCSYGSLLSYCQYYGWETIGIDSSKNAIKFALNLGLNCHSTQLKDFHPANQFDVILLIHVLEHLDNPIQSLQQIQSWLAPGGILYLRVPNIESKFLHLSKINFIGHLKPFEHLYYFSLNTMKLLLEKSDYSYSVRLDGKNTLSDIINNYIRSKLVLSEHWLSINYEESADRKNIYFMLKSIYEKILMRFLANFPIGPRDREIVVVARKK